MVAAAHHHVALPAVRYESFNVAMAGSIVLYDRLAKQQQQQQKEQEQEQQREGEGEGRKGGGHQEQQQRRRRGSGSSDERATDYEHVPCSPSPAIRFKISAARSRLGDRRGVRTSRQLLS